MNQIFRHPTQPEMQAEVILASTTKNAPPLVTMRLRYPRFIHSEIMTHRVFCLAGDAMLDFELPAGTTKGTRRVYSMSLREFADKWFNGAAKGSSSRHNGKALDHLDASAIYSAREIAAELGFKNALNLNRLCRDGVIFGAHKRGRKWVAYGRYWMDWRQNTGTRRFSMRSRLSNMRIRQLNENTGEVQTSTVKNVMASGVKEIFRVSAGSFSVCGSKDHRVYTDSGWKRIEQIVPGQDRIITYRYGTGENADPNRHNKIGGRWVQTWSRQNREVVAARQGHICAESGQPLVPSYHLHHIKLRHIRPDLAFDLNNVVAVNPDAHHALHGVQGWQVGAPIGSVGTLVDSVESEGLCDTYDLEIAGEFPNFFADGVVVHNSRNARSSRAVPVSRMIEEVQNTPVVPWHWGKNQRGMQAGEECDATVRVANFFWLDEAHPTDPAHHIYRMTDWEFENHDAWLEARDQAVEIAEAFTNAGYHKQIVNRLLEPFMWIDTLVSSTDWANFLWLRDHKDAEPHLQDLARLVSNALEDALIDPQTLQPGEWHLPYANDVHTLDTVNSMCGIYGWDVDEVLCKVSAARCARISYKPFDGDAPSITRDLALYDKLVSSNRVHASPLEHQATPDVRLTDPEEWAEPTLHGNLRGWVQFRKTVPNEAVW